MVQAGLIKCSYKYSYSDNTSWFRSGSGQLKSCSYNLHSPHHEGQKNFPRGDHKCNIHLFCIVNLKFDFLKFHFLINCTAFLYHVPNGFKIYDYEGKTVIFLYAIKANDKYFYFESGLEQGNLVWKYLKFLILILLVPVSVDKQTKSFNFR